MRAISMKSRTLPVYALTFRPRVLPSKVKHSVLGAAAQSTCGIFLNAFFSSSDMTVSLLELRPVYTCAPFGLQKCIYGQDIQVYRHTVFTKMLLVLGVP